MFKEYVKQLSDGTIIKANTLEELTKLLAEYKPSKKVETKPKKKSVNLDKLKKDELLDLAAREGIEEFVHYTDSKNKLKDILRKHLEKR